jgi:hypothetical protein
VGVHGEACLFRGNLKSLHVTMDETHKGCVHLQLMDRCGLTFFRGLFLNLVGSFSVVLGELVFAEGAQMLQCPGECIEVDGKLL